MQYQLLLAFRIGLVVLLYVAVMQIVFVARRELQVETKPAAQGRTQAREVVGRLVVVDPGESSLKQDEEFDIQPITTLGRDKTTDIPVDDQAVSALNTRIIYRMNPDKRTGSLWVEDMGSKNGTWVDGNRVYKDHPVAVSPGSILQVVKIRFKIIE